MPPELTDIKATFWNESRGFCDCCGNETRTIWGDLADDKRTLAIYYVQWTAGSKEHWPNFDLIVGPWGDGTSPSDRVLVSLAYYPSRNEFMVIDGRGARYTKLCARALTRADVIGTSLATEIFALVDALWLTEPRLAEIRTH
jgi:hypothetical protein